MIERERERERQKEEERIKCLVYFILKIVKVFAKNSAKNFSNRDSHQNLKARILLKEQRRKEAKQAKKKIQNKAKM